MPRPVTLFTGQWADLPLDDLAAKAGDGASTGSSSPAGATTSRSTGRSPTPATAEAQREILGARARACWAIGAHLVGQAVCDPIDERHQRDPPPEVWGDGEPEGVGPRGRADEGHGPGRRALGVTQVNGFTGSPIWHLLYSFPPNDFDEIERGYEEFAERVGADHRRLRRGGRALRARGAPDRDRVRLRHDAGTLDAIGNRAAFGINLDPSHFAHQHLDPAQFALEFADRIYHVHVKDSLMRLDGAARSSARTSTSARRRAAGTSSRPGHGDVDFEEIFRALNRIGYHGPALDRVGGLGHGPRVGRPGRARLRAPHRLRAVGVAFDAAMQKSGS